MKKIEAVIRPGRLDSVKQELNQIGAPGLTVTEVNGVGSEETQDEEWRGGEYVVDFYQKMKIETVIPDERIEEVLSTIKDAAYSGNPGDGKIFVVSVDDALQIRTGDRGKDALLDVDSSE
jgi:nitrogen regulatory protein PII